MQKTSWRWGGEIQASLSTMTSPFADTKCEAGSCSCCWTLKYPCSSAHSNITPNPPSSATGERATQTLYEEGFWGDRMGLSTLEQLMLIPSGTGKMHSFFLLAFTEIAFHCCLCQQYINDIKALITLELAFGSGDTWLVALQLY